MRKNTRMDTQWPRFEVFVQERDGDPYLDYGSVHAPDAELALLNARDVFARRPEAVGMWVIPTEAIYSKTAEELNQAEKTFLELEPPTPAQYYHVFCKPRPAGTQTQVGVIEATSAQQALEAAVAVFSNSFPKNHPPTVWWVFPEQGVTASLPADFASLYAPAHEKNFRLSTDFRTITIMRSLKKK